MADLADDQVAIPNGPAPQTHTVTHLDGVIPKAVQATFDGSGAGGAFLPTLIIAGKEGREVARIPAPEVAAGATAEVSWFPRGKLAAAAKAATASLPACFVDGPSLTLNTWVPNNYTAVPWNLFQTNDPTTFAFPGSGGSTTVRHLTKGLYRAVFIPQFQGFNFPVAPGLFIYTIVGFGGTRDPTEFSINHTNAAWAEGNTNASGRDAPHVDELYNLAGAGDFKVDAAWTGAGSITFTPRMFVYRVGDRLT